MNNTTYAPYSAMWDAIGGDHELSAKATDDKGLSKSSGGNKLSYYL